MCDGSTAVQQGGVCVMGLSVCDESYGSAMSSWVRSEFVGVQWVWVGVQEVSGCAKQVCVDM